MPQVIFTYLEIGSVGPTEALVVPVAAWIDWGATERALRRGGPLPPSSRLGLLLSVTVTMVGVLVLLGILLP